MKPLLLILISFISMKALAATHPYQACVQKLASDIANDTYLTIQETAIIDYGHSTYKSTIVEKVGGKWQKPAYWSNGRSYHNFLVKAKTDRTELEFRFVARLFERKKSAFGSGTSQTEYECCPVDNEIPIKDLGSGLVKKIFRYRTCYDLIENNDDVVSSKELKTGLCADYGKKTVTWTTSREWDYENKTPAPCNWHESKTGKTGCVSTDWEFNKTIWNHKGCNIKGGNAEPDVMTEFEK